MAAVDAGPASGTFSVTPNDATALPVGRALFVGGAGTIVGRLVDDTADVTFSGIAAGAIIPGRFKLVKATGTTATGIVVLF